MNPVDDILKKLQDEINRRKNPIAGAPQQKVPVYFDPKKKWSDYSNEQQQELFGLINPQAKEQLYTQSETRGTAPYQYQYKTAPSKYLYDASGNVERTSDGKPVINPVYREGKLGSVFLATNLALQNAGGVQADPFSKLGATLAGVFGGLFMKDIGTDINYFRATEQVKAENKEAIATSAADSRARKAGNDAARSGVLLETATQVKNRKAYDYAKEVNKDRSVSASRNFFADYLAYRNFRENGDPGDDALTGMRAHLGALLQAQEADITPEEIANADFDKLIDWFNVYGLADKAKPEVWEDGSVNILSRSNNYVPVMDQDGKQVFDYSQIEKNIRTQAAKGVQFDEEELKSITKQAEMFFGNWYKQHYPSLKSGAPAKSSLRKPEDRQMYAQFYKLALFNAAYAKVEEKEKSKYSTFYYADEDGQKRTANTADMVRANTPKDQRGGGVPGAVAENTSLPGVDLSAAQQPIINYYNITQPNIANLRHVNTEQVNEALRPYLSDFVTGKTKEDYDRGQQAFTNRLNVLETNRNRTPQENLELRILQAYRVSMRSIGENYFTPITDDQINKTTNGVTLYGLYEKLQSRKNNGIGNLDELDVLLKAVDDRANTLYPKPKDKWLLKNDPNPNNQVDLFKFQDINKNDVYLRLNGYGELVWAININKEKSPDTFAALTNDYGAKWESANREQKSKGLREGGGGASFRLVLANYGDVPTWVIFSDR